MNKTNIGQRLCAQTQFKSLLLLTLLASTALAQQPLMPPLSLDIASPASLDEFNVVPNDGRCDSSRSTWTLRQHATWLLGLKPRQVMPSAPTLALPEAPSIELQPTLAALPQLPDMPRDAVILVQHTEPVLAPEQPTLLAAPTEAPVVTAGGESKGDAPAVAQALQTAPHSLDLRPVLSGPVPALPLEAMAAESLLQVDVSGVDPAKLGAVTTSAPESLIDSFGFRPPTGFSMSDNEPASLVASPAHAKPVSIHEGFAPKSSSANQSAQLSTDSGPIHNRLSDADVAEETEADRTEKVFQKIASKKSNTRSVEKSLSDRDLLVASLPVEVSSDNDKSSRGSRPEVLTPPSRLSKPAPIALPLSDAMPIASTGVESVIGERPSLSEDSQSAEAKTQPAASALKAAAQFAAEKTADAPADKPVESLIDSIVPPTLLAAQASKSPEPLIEKSVPAPVEQLVKRQPPKAAEKVTLSDTNPLALERTVVKAANVAIPDSTERTSSVVPTSHEMDEGRHQLAEYAKMAAKMQQAIKQKFPNCRVKITCNEDGLIADGHVTNNAEASKVLSYVRKTSLCPVADRITTSK